MSHTFPPTVISSTGVCPVLTARTPWLAPPRGTRSCGARPALLRVRALLHSAVSVVSESPAAPRGHLSRAGPVSVAAVARTRASRTFACGEICVLLLPGPTDQVFSSHDSVSLHRAAGAPSGRPPRSHAGARARERSPVTAAAGAPDPRGAVWRADRRAVGGQWDASLRGLRRGGFAAPRRADTAPVRRCAAGPQGWCGYGLSPSRSRSIASAVVAVCRLVCSATQPAGGPSGMMTASMAGPLSACSITLALASNSLCCAARWSTRSSVGLTRPWPRSRPAPA